MDLVDVEIVQFLRAVLNDPVFHVALAHDDVGLGRVRIEKRRRLAIDGEIKLGWAVRIFRILRLFGEIELALAHGWTSPSQSRFLRR